MEIGHIIPHIEALVFASDRPLTAMDITELINNAFGFMEDKITLEQVVTAMDGIIEKYQSEFYPFELRESGGGWQFLTKKDYHKTIAQINGEKFLKRLSNAALETLAIIAYKQPITKADIEAIRGVSCDYSIQKLLEKELIVITGRNENLPGKPLIYNTSRNFMDYFGLNSVDDLPKLKEVFDESVSPTGVRSDKPDENDSGQEEIENNEGHGSLVVSENGELVPDFLENSEAEESENSDDSEVHDEEGQIQEDATPDIDFNDEADNESESREVGENDEVETSTEENAIPEGSETDSDTLNEEEDISGLADEDDFISDTDDEDLGSEEESESGEPRENESDLSTSDDDEMYSEENDPGLPPDDAGDDEEKDKDS